ncbi:MAG: 2-oxoacid:ferredoxin oxidoreductase subunit gamma [Methanobacterium sp.]
MRKDIRIAGFGGQGIILAGIVIGRAASIHDNLFAVQTQSYGPEARGGASRTEIVISDSEIDYPKVQCPNIFVAMSHTALMAYLDDLKDGGILIADSDMINEEEVVPFVLKHNIDYYRAPATKTAAQKIGLNIVANMVMVGAITKATKVVSKEAARKAIAEIVPPGTEAKNIAAFEAGLELIKED